jgi:hypothetical protein
MYYNGVIDVLQRWDGFLAVRVPLKTPLSKQEGNRRGEGLRASPSSDPPRTLLGPSSDHAAMAVLGAQEFYAVWSEAHGRHYYVNRETQETQWQAPDSEGAKVVLAVPLPPSPSPNKGPMEAAGRRNGAGGESPSPASQYGRGGWSPVSGTSNSTVSYDNALGSSRDGQVGSATRPPRLQVQTPRSNRANDLRASWRERPPPSPASCSSPTADRVRRGLMNVEDWLAAKAAEYAARRVALSDERGRKETEQLTLSPRINRSSRNMLERGGGRLELSQRLVVDQDRRERLARRMARDARRREESELTLRPKLTDRAQRIHRTMDDLMAFEEMKNARNRRRREALARRSLDGLTGAPEVNPRSRKIASHMQALGIIAPRDIPVGDRLHWAAAERHLRDADEAEMRDRSAREHATPRLVSAPLTRRKGEGSSARGAEESAWDRLYEQGLESRERMEELAARRRKAEEKQAREATRAVHVNPKSRVLERRARGRDSGQSPRAVEDVLTDCGRRVHEKLATMRARRDARLREEASRSRLGARSKEMAEQREARLGETPTQRLYHPVSIPQMPPSLAPADLPSAKSSTHLLRSKYKGRVPPMRQRMNNWVEGVRERREKIAADIAVKQESELTFTPRIESSSSFVRAQPQEGNVFTRGEELCARKEAWRSEQLRRKLEDELAECTHVPKLSRLQKMSSSPLNLSSPHAAMGRTSTTVLSTPPSRAGGSRGRGAGEASGILWGEDSAEVVTPARLRSNSELSGGPLPPGWLAFETKEGLYYFNSLDGTTQWDVPVEEF